MALALRLTPSLAPSVAPVPRQAPEPKGRHLALVPKAPPAIAADRRAFGILAILACCALFSMSDTASKLLTRSLPPLEVAWLRYVVFLLATAPFLLHGRAMWATPRLKLQLSRATASVVSTTIAIVSFGFLPVADSTAIGFLAPVVVTAIAAFCLRERVSPRRWAAALLGLIGVLIIVEPGSGAFKLVSLIPLAGSFASAVSSVATRLVREERADTTLFYAALVGFAVLSVPVALVWQTPDRHDLALAGAAGGFAVLASLATVIAYRHAPASLLQPFTYSQLLWAGGFGVLVFGTVPGFAMVLGAAVIAAGGLYTAFAEDRGERGAQKGLFSRTRLGYEGLGAGPGGTGSRTGSLLAGSRSPPRRPRGAKPTMG